MRAACKVVCVGYLAPAVLCPGRLAGVVSDPRDFVVPGAVVALRCAGITGSSKATSKAGLNSLLGMGPAIAKSP